jgi:hypothetical protein
MKKYSDLELQNNRALIFAAEVLLESMHFDTNDIFDLKRRKASDELEDLRLLIEAARE